MRGTKIFTASLFLVAAATCSAATPSYFPLQPGNSWLFRGVSRWFNAEPVTIEVQGTERFRDRDYSRVTFLGRTIYLRATDAGIVSFNAASGEESPWLPFDGAVGVSSPIDIEP